MKVETVIRPAAPLDAVAIVKLIKNGYRERMLSYQVPNDGLALELILRMILKGFTVVAERGKRIVGVHANFVHPEEWGTVNYIDNVFFYVLPPERKHGTADRILQIVHENADKAQLFARLGTVVGEEGDPREATHIEWLNRKGYRYAGSVFFREPKSDQSKPRNADGKQP